MRLRRSILAAVLAPTVALASVTPAVAETDTQNSSTSTSSSAEGSSDSDEWWDGLHPSAKVASGIAAATGISVAFGILRTIFYNIFHV